jgi:hypothetical protein
VRYVQLTPHQAQDNTQPHCPCTSTPHQGMSLQLLRFMVCHATARQPNGWKRYNITITAFKQPSCRNAAGPSYAIAAAYCTNINTATKG